MIKIYSNLVILPLQAAPKGSDFLLSKLNRKSGYATSLLNKLKSLLQNI